MKLTFRKSDRDAIILLILIVLVVVVLFPLLRDREGTPAGRSLERVQTATRKNSIMRGSSSLPSGSASVASRQMTEGDRGRLFYFDPNTADSTQLLQLGLRPWQVRNIYKYRAKGGRYRQKEDFAMLYGLTLEHYRRLEPYIRIKPEVMARDVIKRARPHSPKANVPVTTQSLPEHSTITPTKISQGKLIDINTADTAELKRIPGIGSYFARRIVELRQRRQAFLSPDELLTIRNFPETALTYMTASQNFAKIHINHSSLQQLKAHPLINHTQATDILRFRRLNGNIRSVTDISNLPSFNSEQLARLEPFLLFD